MEKYPLIRKIFLYLFSMVGLIMMIIGCVNFLDMGLKAFVFTGAEEQEKLSWMTPPYSMPCGVDAKLNPTSENQNGKEVKLTEAEYQQFQSMSVDYKNWQERQNKFDYTSSNRQRSASINISLILVGFPLYLYHWLTIRREMKV